MFSRLKTSLQLAQLKWSIKTGHGGLHLCVLCTLLKSSFVALISFQVLFSSWMQMQKNSSKERSWVKNMGWKSWQFSLAVDVKGKSCHPECTDSLNKTNELNTSHADRSDSGLHPLSVHIKTHWAQFYLGHKPQVQSYKYLRTTKTEAVCRKGRQRLSCLWKLSSFHINKATFFILLLSV